MKIHEYQARNLLAEYGVPVPDGIAVENAADAVKAAEKIGLPIVLKAQVHTGGRGKAGGVKAVKAIEEVESTAQEILNLIIKDLPVRKLLVTSAAQIEKEVYLGLLVDRNSSALTFIGCADGGVEIEETAKVSPEKILRLAVPMASAESLTPDWYLEFASRLLPKPGEARVTAGIMTNMVKLMKGKDCALVEINPLAVINGGEVVALDAKILLDDNALFRHDELVAMRDMGSEDVDELDAKEAGLSFIRLDGGIGCMVNGAGLAMATMDTIKYYGGEPANFLDVGGSSNPDKIVTAFQMILKDKNVSVIFINIFGGITRCDDVARGILAAREKFDMSVPVVIRLVGTNEDKAREILADTEMTVALTLEQGAQMVVEMGRKT